MKKIICLGSATRDIFITLRETRVVDNKNDITAKKLMAFEFGAKEYAEDFFEEVGGSAVNVGAGLVKLELRPFIFSRVSKGETGKWILKKIGRLKVKKNYMQETGSAPSETAVVISDKKNRDHVILRTGDSVENFNLEKAVDKFQEKAHWIFVASQKENWQNKMKLMLEFAKIKKARIAFNPSGYQIENNAKELAQILKDVEILFINRDEAIELIKKINGVVKDEIKSLLNDIKELGAKVVIITDGEKGAYATNGKENFYLKAEVIEKSDTVGAGDAFASGFLGSYIEDGDIKKALAWGIANSAGVVSKVGATNGLLTRKELKRQGEILIKKVEII